MLRNYRTLLRRDLYDISKEHDYLEGRPNKRLLYDRAVVQLQKFIGGVMITAGFGFMLGLQEAAAFSDTESIILRVGTGAIAASGLILAGVGLGQLSQTGSEVNDYLEGRANQPPYPAHAPESV